MLRYAVKDVAPSRPRADRLQRFSWRSDSAATRRRRSDPADSV